MTHQDALTGLPNEVQFTANLVEAMTAGDGIAARFALLQIDIERLREINNALGFANGDRVLQEFGKRLQNAVPTYAKIARLRGDEFAVLLPGFDRHLALSFAAHIERVFAQPFAIADLSLDLSVKAGVVLYPDHGSAPHDLYRCVDLAVYHAKRRGVGYAFFEPSYDPDQRQRLGLAGELRQAIEHGDLRCYVQPKVEMASGRVCGVEALVRWQHPRHGFLTPGEFIPLAEQTGLIKPLTEWMIEFALKLNAKWTHQGCVVPIAVNLSARSLHNDAFLKTLCRMLAQHDAAAGALELEITESSLMEDAVQALDILNSLRQMGVPLHIDDFGTGYSSLSYLQKLPVSCIKIDQSFVRSMCKNKDDAMIVRSTIDLLHDLGRKAVAEGVETQEAWNELKRLGCDIAQGYFIAKPMPADEFPGWFENFLVSRREEIVQ